MRPAGIFTAVGAIPLALSAGVLLPALYGHAFQAAILPAQVIILGLTAEGVGGVVTAYLYGDGRPGLNSLAMGAGVVVTVVLDLLLIPRYGAMGGAIASCAAYLTTTGALVTCFWSLNRPKLAVTPVPVGVES